MLHTYVDGQILLKDDTCFHYPCTEVNDVLYRKLYNFIITSHIGGECNVWMHLQMAYTSESTSAMMLAISNEKIRRCVSKQSLSRLYSMHCNTTCKMHPILVRMKPITYHLV